jgi:omega-amidase
VHSAEGAEDIVIVAGIQHDIVWEDPQANFDALAPKIADAAARGARLIVCSEMFSTGFSMHTERIGEPIGGPSSQFLSQQAQAHGVWLCASMPERADGASLPSNQLVLAGPDGSEHRYAKIHPFTYGREHEHYAAGDTFLTVDVEGVRCSFFVCYDLRFADEFWAIAPDTDCYIIPANWPASRRVHWVVLLQARAIENQAYVVGVNRVGAGGSLTYAGDSAIVDPFGVVCAQGDDQPDTLYANVDPAIVEQVRAEYPFLQDRRASRP